MRERAWVLLLSVPVVVDWTRLFPAATAQLYQRPVLS